MVLFVKILNDGLVRVVFSVCGSVLYFFYVVGDGELVGIGF